MWYVPSRSCLKRSCDQVAGGRLGCLHEQWRGQLQDGQRLTLLSKWAPPGLAPADPATRRARHRGAWARLLSLIHISEPTRPEPI
eukprot:3752297-Pyramimonas_sp.AAC.1